MREMAALLKTIAWPVVVLVALWALRSSILSLLSALSGKIDRASRLKLGGKAGLELVEEIVRGSIISGQSSRTATVEEFEKLATQYNEMKITDEAERVAERQRLADRLGELALHLNIKRSEIPQNASEAHLVAIATAMALRPMARGDLDTLEKAARISDYNFTRYRIVLALAPMLARPKIGARALRRIGIVLARYRGGQTERIDSSVTTAPNR